MQIRFSVSKEAAAYLRWYAKNVLLEDSEHSAARHLMQAQLEQMRRAHRKDEPAPGDLPSVED
jgi:hypothetical protein